MVVVLQSKGKQGCAKISDEKFKFEYSKQREPMTQQGILYKCASLFECLDVAVDVRRYRMHCSASRRPRLSLGSTRCHLHSLKCRKPISPKMSFIQPGACLKGDALPRDTSNITVRALGTIDTYSYAISSEVAASAIYQVSEATGLPVFEPY